MIEKLAVRTGFSTLYNQASFGLGLKLSKFNLDYAIAFHQRLGTSNNISLNYVIRNSQKTKIEVEPEH